MLFAKRIGKCAVHQLDKLFVIFGQFTSPSTQDLVNKHHIAGNIILNGSAFGVRQFVRLFIDLLIDFLFKLCGFSRLNLAPCLFALLPFLIGLPVNGHALAVLFRPVLILRVNGDHCATAVEHVRRGCFRVFRVFYIAEFAFERLVIRHFLSVKVTVRITGALIVCGKPAFVNLNAHCGGIFHLFLPACALRRTEGGSGEHPHFRFVAGCQRTTQAVGDLRDAIALDDPLPHDVIDPVIIPDIVFFFVDLPFREQLRLICHQTGNGFRIIQVE